MPIDADNLPFILYTQEGRAALEHLKYADHYLVLVGIGARKVHGYTTRARASIHAAIAIMNYDYDLYKQICSKNRLKSYY